MLNGLRFFLYGSICFFILAFHSDAFRKCFDVLTSRGYFFEDDLFIFYNCVLFFILVIYIFWLSGATFMSWRMPVWIHMFPIFIIFLLIYKNGGGGTSHGRTSHLFVPQRYEASPVLLTMDAMLIVQKFLLENPCTPENIEKLRRLLNKRRSGYRNYGIMQGFDIEVYEQDIPITELSDDKERKRPGTIFVACNKDESSFSITATVTSSMPTGNLAFIVDGVGRPVILVGRMQQK